jgi:hypothetical protein
MNIRTKSLSGMTLLGMALFLALAESRAGVEKSRSANGGTVTRIRTNGHIASVNLSDGGYVGFLIVSRDQVSGTSVLDFSYAARNPVNPDSVFLWQGVGEIPNGAFTNAPNWRAARLAVTMPFPVIRYEIDLLTGEVTSTPWLRITFDLTWVPDGFFTSFEQAERHSTFGPVKEYFNGASNRVSVSVSGMWDGHTMTNGSGTLDDSQNHTVIREITVEPNP